MNIQKMRAAWLAVADACGRASQVDTWADVGPLIVDAVDAPLGAYWSWSDLGDAIRAMCGPDEDEAPAADAALLASANRALTAELEAARAEVERLHADALDAFVPRHILAALSNAKRAFQSRDAMPLATVNTYLQPTVDAAMAWIRHVEAERDEARSQAARLTRILAVERGDQAQAPAGSSRWAAVEDLLTWVDEPYPEILELIGYLRPFAAAWALEAVDAERGGVSNG